MPEMLRLEGVRVAIQGAEVVRGVSFGVPRGGLVALVGRNGAGKTTTVRSVMGLVALRGGSIRVDDHDLAEVPAFARAKLGIGYVPEDRRLIGQLSVADNLLLPAGAGGRSQATRRLEHVYSIMPEVPPLARRVGPPPRGGRPEKGGPGGGPRGAPPSAPRRR